MGWGPPRAILEEFFPLRALLLAALFAGSLAAPTLAPAQYDPYASRAENQVNSLNRDMTRQQQSRAFQQQNQFETNSLRNDLSRAVPPLVPNPSMGAPIRR